MRIWERLLRRACQLSTHSILPHSAPAALEIFSLNCRGLASREKRQDIFSYIDTNNYDICFLQDIHWDKRTFDLALEEWGYKIVCSPFTTQSRGTAILFKNSFEFEILKSTCDERGNYTLCEISLHNGFSLILGSVYGPNQDDPAFIHTLSDLLEEFNNPNMLLGGDWNCTRSFEVDNLNYISENNRRMSKALGDLCNNYSLVDAWRINNPTVKKFTWLQGVSNKQSRLDYYLCNDELLSITKNFSIKHKYWSDHAPITCTLLLDNASRGPGTWKMNNSLLKEKEFSKMIIKEINTF